MPITDKCRIENIAKDQGYTILRGTYEGAECASYVRGEREVWVKYSRNGYVTAASFRPDHTTLEHYFIATGKGRASAVIEYLDGRQGGPLAPLGPVAVNLACYETEWKHIGRDEWHATGASGILYRAHVSPTGTVVYANGQRFTSAESVTDAVAAVEALENKPSTTTPARPTDPNLAVRILAGKEAELLNSARLNDAAARKPGLPQDRVANYKGWAAAYRADAAVISAAIRKLV